MPNPSTALSPAQIDHFITDGFLRIDNAFPRELADAGRIILWADTGCDPDDPSTWTRPVIRLNQYGQAPFREAVNTPVLHQAFDQLVGPARWLPRHALGTFPVRFPSPDDPGDAGWHIDVSFGLENPDFMSWRASITSKNRALLMLFLFSDVGEADAPTRIRIGSHLDIARQLAPAGEAGLSVRELAKNGFAETAHCPETLATGPAGTVYLCHPFLVHAAQPPSRHHAPLHGPAPLGLAQPFLLHRPDGDYSPVEAAIRLALPTI